MKAVIVQFPFGFAAFNNENELVAKVLFPKKPQAAAKALAKIEAEKVTDELSDLVTQLKAAGFDVFALESADMAAKAQKKIGVKTEVAEPAEV